MTRRLLATLTLLALAAPTLSACLSSSDLSGEAPKVGYRPDGETEPPPAPLLPSDGRHVVQRGDTVFGISRRYGLPLRAVMDANGLQPPYTLVPGQRLVLPVMRVHVVQGGETLTKISKAHGVSVGDLSRLNDLKPPFTLAQGQRLTLPPEAGYVTVAEGHALREDQRAGLVVSGEDKVFPAPRVSVAGEDLAPLQPASPPPAAAPSYAQAQPAPAAQPLRVAAQPARQPFQPTPPPGSTRQVASIAAPKAAPQPTTTAVRPVAAPAQPAAKKSLSVVPKPPALTGSRFSWPVDGQILSSYGAKDDGRHNDGINIAARKGTPIRAAQSGVVAYVGNELRGFGNLLLISHDGGWITAYAHADSFAVQPGDVVKRGQVIGKVGKSGSVDTPQLHFELRKGKRAVNPRSYFSQT